jgi:hypothetical protein
MPRLMRIPPNVTQIMSAVPVQGTDLTIINNRYIVSSESVLQDDHPICSCARDLVPNPEKFLPSEIEAIHHTTTIIVNAMARLGKVNAGMEHAYELGMLRQVDAVNEVIRHCRLERNLGCYDLVLAVDYLYGHMRTPEGGEQ